MRILPARVVRAGQSTRPKFDRRADSRFGPPALVCVPSGRSPLPPHRPVVDADVVESKRSVVPVDDAVSALHEGMASHKVYHGYACGCCHYRGGLKIEMPKILWCSCTAAITALIMETEKHGREIT